MKERAMSAMAGILIVPVMLMLVGWPQPSSAAHECDLRIGSGYTQDELERPLPPGYVNLGAIGCDYGDALNGETYYLTPGATWLTVIWVRAYTKPTDGEIKFDDGDWQSFSWSSDGGVWQSKTMAIPLGTIRVTARGKIDVGGQERSRQVTYWATPQ